MAVAAALISTTPVLAADKSGLSPNTISLPTGPGSVEGLGEAFQISANTGTAKFSVPLRLPRGTAGHAPSVALLYDGGSGKSVLGQGWSMPMAYVQRQTEKGIPRYVDGPNGNDDDLDGEIDDADEMDRFIDSDSEELVPVQDGESVSYFAKNEGGFVRYRRQGQHWSANRPDGTLLVFGESASARIADPSDPSRVFRWLLEREVDTRGNTIVYRYKTFAGEENTGQVYLAAIEYGAGSPPWGGGFHFVSFLYEPRPDWFEDCRPGFAVRTGMRMTRIETGTQGIQLSGHLSGDFNADGSGDLLNRRYSIGYSPSAPLSLLVSVAVVGANGQDSLPAARFGYTGSLLPASASASAGWIHSQDAPALVFDSSSVDFIDLNGDALPDILRASAPGTAHSVFFNQGESSSAGTFSVRWSGPEEVAATAGTGDPWDLALQNNSVLLADADGDGLSDLVQMTPQATYYFPSSPPGDGSARWGARRILNSEDVVPPSPFGSGGSTRTLDVDFDKRADIIRSISVGDGFGYQIWFNQGDGTFSQRLTVGPETGYDLGAPGVQIADLNGDRIQDIAWVRPSQIVYTANLGNGIWSPEKSMPIPGETLTSDWILRASLRDINGDGLADLVVDRPEPQTLWVWPNRGNGSFGSRTVVTGLPANLSPSTAVRWVDLNGNGTIDMVFGDSSLEGGERIQALDLGRVFGFEPRPWLLNSAENGIGRRETLVYKTSTRFAAEDGGGSGPYRYSWKYPLPFPVEVVSEVKTSDSLGGEYVTKFRYHDGFYDPEEKQFRGFGRVEQEEIGDSTAPTLVTLMNFDTGASDEARKGKLLRQIHQSSSGGVFSDATNTYATKNLYSGIDGRSVKFAHEAFEAVDIIEQGAGSARRVETAFAYDNYGNKLVETEYGVVGGENSGVSNDERVTRAIFTSSFAAARSRWILRLPVSETVESLSGQAVAKSLYFYDDEGFSGGNPGAVSKANLTLVRKAVDASAGSFVDAQRMAYDAYGNPVGILDPLGTSPGAPHSRSITYDSATHTYPVSEQVHVGDPGGTLAASASYDAGLGTVLSSTDFNGNVTLYSNDGLGRLTSLTKPGDSPGSPTESYDYKLGMPLSGNRVINWIEVRKRETPGGGTCDSRMFFDGLGRDIMTRTEGETGGQIVVSGAVVFNSRRKEWKKYLPYFDGGSLDFSNPSSSAEFVETRYDALCRETRTVNPPESGGGPRLEARTDYLPLTAVLYDEEDSSPGSPHYNTPHMQYKDGLDRLIGVDEVNQAGSVTGTFQTRYQYDLLDNLTRITDSQGNVKTMTYDGLKRMTFMDDPDRGVMQYTYDQASNLVETRDAKGQRIAMTYDGANRIKTEDYLDAANLSPDVTYTYDSASPVPAGDGSTATPSNVLGKLVKVSDLSGEEWLSYDTRGRTAWKIKRIADPGNGVLTSYQSKFAYDSLDRVTRLDYPDGDHVGYTYNSRNLPATISGGSGGIITGISYAASGQMSSITYGNGVGTSYQYDPRLRVRSLSTSGPQGSLIDFAYEFDGASNILRIDDNRGGLPSNSPRRNTQVFAYDDLYRLTSASYPGTGGSIAYAYDRIGNMISQNSNIADVENGMPLVNLGAMSYGGSAGPGGRQGRDGGQPGPHALTAVAGGNRSYAYDPNGNMENIDGLACTWDFKDRLVAVENSSMRAEYSYDYTDRRISKKVTPKSSQISNSAPDITLYVDRTFELRPGYETVKYVWNGETRVARVTSNLNTTQRIQRFALQPGWNILALAVTLSDGDTQIRTGPVNEVVRYAPSTRDYHRISGSESVPAGTLLRVHSSAATTLSLRGEWSAPAAMNVAAGAQWLMNTRFAPLDISSALPMNDPLWFWQANTQSWNMRIPQLPTFSRHPAKLQPGEALFTTTTAAYVISPSDPTLDIRYYHQDHLGSSSVMSDANGGLVSETAFYPFGHLRNEHEPRSVKEVYGFTQKEKDGESGLNYFEARYLAATVARFTRVDGALEQPSASYLKTPQTLNAYAYCANRPIILHDPSGDVALLAPLLAGPVINFVATALTYYAIASVALHSDPANAPGPNDKVLPAQSNAEWAIDIGAIVCPVPGSGKIATLAEKKFLAPMAQKITSSGMQALRETRKVVTTEGVPGMTKATHKALKGAMKESSALFQQSGKKVVKDVAGNQLTDPYKGILGISSEAKPQSKPSATSGSTRQSPTSFPSPEPPTPP